MPLGIGQSQIKSPRSTTGENSVQTTPHLRQRKFRGACGLPECVRLELPYFLALFFSFPCFSRRSCLPDVARVRHYEHACTFLFSSQAAVAVCGSTWYGRRSALKGYQNAQPGS